MKHYLFGTAAAITLLATPAIADAQVNFDDRRDYYATGAGAVLGGVLGSNLAGTGVQDEGTAIGAVLGGVIGNAIGNRSGYSQPVGYGSQGYGYSQQGYAQSYGQPYGYGQPQGGQVLGYVNGGYVNGGQFPTDSVSLPGTYGPAGGVGGYSYAGQSGYGVSMPGTYGAAPQGQVLGYVAGPVMTQTYAQPAQALQQRVIVKTVQAPAPAPEIRYIDREVERIVEKRVEVPVERIVEKRVEVPVERIVERVEYVDRPVERIVEVPVERIVEKRVEVPIERIEYVDRVVEVPVDRIVEKRVEVPVERIVEKRVEVPVERIVEVPVERIVRVPCCEGSQGRASHHLNSYEGKPAHHHKTQKHSYHHAMPAAPAYSSHSSGSYSSHGSAATAAPCPSGTSRQSDGTCLQSAGVIAQSTRYSAPATPSASSTYSSSTYGRTETVPCPLGAARQDDGSCLLTGAYGGPTQSWSGGHNSGVYTGNETLAGGHNGQ